jgi:hypothetical protein
MRRVYLDNDVYSIIVRRQVTPESPAIEIIQPRSLMSSKIPRQGGSGTSGSLNDCSRTHCRLRGR